MARIGPGARVVSTWDYGEDGEPRAGILPYGFSEAANAVLWESPPELEYVDRNDFMILTEGS